MKHSLPWLLSAAVILAGCAQVQGQLPSGPDVLTGRAILTEGGTTRSCEDVTLVRPTSSIAGKIGALVNASDGGFIGAAALDDLQNDPDFERLSRTARCGEHGEFVFQGVAEGRYYLIAQVTWLLRLAHRGGFIIRPVDVSSRANAVDMSMEIKRLAAGKPGGVAEAQQNGQTFIFVGAALGITALGLIASSHAYLISPASPSSTQ